MKKKSQKKEPTMRKKNQKKEPTMSQRPRTHLRKNSLLTPGT